MNKVLLFWISSFLLLSVKAGAQQDSFSVRAQRYVDKYYALAIAEQVRCGIPAAVTLAQGVLETEAGRSELACSANNHFGIKCKSDYSGEKFFHDDDAPKECFKMYRCAEDSYKDHSDYLKRNPRYNPLFALSQTDYASWAMCLKKCGYATNPQYAQRLIKIIEDFKLQQYTYAAMDSSLLPGRTVNLKPASQQPAAQQQAQAPVADSNSIVITTPFPSGKVVAGAKKITKEEVKTSAPEPQPAAIAKPLEVPAATATLAPVQETPKQNTQPIAETKHTDSLHHIIVTDGPLPIQAAANQAVDTPVRTAVAAEAQPTQPSLDTRYDSGKIIIVNGLKAFYAYKGEVLLQYAVKYNIRYAHLLEINDLPDGPLEANMPIYLEKKLTSGTHARHTVREGESMYMISQMEGMQLRRLLALNMMDINDEPATGVILELQNGVFKKPALRSVSQGPAQGNMTVMLGKSTPPSDMITINRSPAPTPKHIDTTQSEKVKPYVETIPVANAAGTEHAAQTTAPTAAMDTTNMGVPKNITANTNATTAPTAQAPSQQAATNIPAKQDMATAAQKQVKEDSTIDDLAALKAELDKVVYTDDSKLISKAAPDTKPADTKAATPKQTVPAKARKTRDDDDDDEEDNKKGSNYYTIKDGETLGGIANRHHTTVKKLMQLNHIKADQIRAGRKLRIK